MKGTASTSGDPKAVGTLGQSQTEEDVVPSTWVRGLSRLGEIQLQPREDLVVMEHREL